MYYAFIIVVAVVLSVAAAALEVSTPITFIVIFTFVFAGFVIGRLYPILWTKNVEKTERYIKKNLKDPMLHLYYAIANREDKEVDEAMRKILRKYTGAEKQALFRTIHSLYKEDIEAAETTVELIQPRAYKEYYLAAIVIEKEELEKAAELIDDITVPWMETALLCELEQKRGDQDKAIEYARATLEKTRGVQKYQYVKEFERVGLI